MRNLNQEKKKKMVNYEVVFKMQFDRGMMIIIYKITVSRERLRDFLWYPSRFCHLKKYISTREK